jgi:PPOX class probable F420-dependent enzyme
VTLPDRVRELVDGRNFAHVATVRADGSPDVVPVWIGREDDLLVFFTQTTSSKARNLELDPRVAISIVDHEHPYLAANVRGRVVERRTEPEIWDTIDGLARKYTGEPFPFRPPTTVLCFVRVDSAGSRELPFRHETP